MRSLYLPATFAWILCALPPISFSTDAEAAPKQTDELKVTATFTHGINGPPRRAAKGVVCDIFCANLKIEGLHRNSDGKVDFSLQMTVLDKDGRVASEVPWKRDTYAATSPTYVAVEFRVSKRVNPDMAGSWTWRIQVQDHCSGKKSATETRFETVMPSGIAIMGIHYGRDEKCLGSCGASFVVGETFHLSAAVLNYTVKDGISHVRASLRVLHETGEPTDWPECVVEDEQTGSLYSSHDVNQVLPLNFSSSGFRPGRFIVELKVHDLNGGSSTTEYLPLLVTENPDWNLDDMQIARLRAETERKQQTR